MKQISSIHNQFIKSLVQLQEKPRERKNSAKFLIEGVRETDLAFKAGYEFEAILFVPELVSISDANLDDQTELIEISHDVYQKLAYRDSTEGLIAVAKSRDHSLDRLELPENALILVAEAPEKPGNIGAILRTADAAAVDAVIIANPKTDLYNPNIIRSSVGCVFTNQVATGTTDEVINFLKRRQISIFSAALQDSVSYHEQDFRRASAIVVGTEDAGLSQPWRDAATSNVMIPMRGQIDSMNVSVAAAILIFEACRQRGFN